MVPADATTMYMRVIAVGSGSGFLGEAAPNIQLWPEWGIMATVPEAPDQVSVRLDMHRKPVGTASYTCEDNDVYMVRLDISDKGLPLWRVCITNTSTQELGFVWTTGQLPEDVVQPRMSITHELRTSVKAGEQAMNMVADVANIGPGPLLITDAAGTDLGGGFTLEKVPARLEPNEHSAIEISAEGAVAELGSGGNRTVTYVIGCNDRDKPNATIVLGCDVQAAPPTKATESGGSVAAARKYIADHPFYRKRRFTLGEAVSAHEAAALGDSASRSAHFIAPELRPEADGGAPAPEEPDEDKGA
ncbi:hypothetical protein PO587_33070 [Streptomyces gilvifuscus]|uniref:Uncharacterized protein n=1 Tax=Streptomyces gilvifuscus TaxID=1550617 RepID=A0ABT5G3S4_9ACTN|nr:hypothetical protein [Streptomyces gilvifuscus]MDC2959276.1 hypothetical protein [Streptomyces gilvifuscus]